MKIVSTATACLLFIASGLFIASNAVPEWYVIHAYSSKYYKYR